MYLIDTNVWIELILQQEKAETVRQLFLKLDASEMYITDFAMHSIGVILLNLKKDKSFEEFLIDTIEDSGVSLISLSIDELKQIIKIRQQYNLDFDDAYQYVAAENNDLTLVSFDSDFDHTERGRKTPAKILQDL